MCEPPTCRKDFLQKATKRTKVEFSASKESLGYLRFLLLDRIRRGALDGPKHHWRRRAPPSMTKPSTAVQLFCHSFVIPVYPPWRVICSSLVCIRVHLWLAETPKIKKKCLHISAHAGK